MLLTSTPLSFIAAMSSEPRDSRLLELVDDSGETGTLWGWTKAEFSRWFVVFLGIFGTGGFFVLCFTDSMGEHYTDFYDEDVSFFQKDLHGESDSAYYWGLMVLSFILAFLSTVYRDTVVPTRYKIANANDSDFLKLYAEYYVNGLGFGLNLLLSVFWETIYETLWIFIALTDMYGVLFVLVGRVLAVLVITAAFNKRQMQIKSKIGRSVSKLGRYSRKPGRLKF